MATILVCDDDKDIVEAISISKGLRWTTGNFGFTEK